MEITNRQNILVTGGAGFIGAHLVNALASQGHRVRVYDNLFTGSAERLAPSENLSVQIGDVLDKNALEAAFETFRPTLVFHLAALSYIPYCIQHARETLRVNVEGTQAVLDTCAKFPVAKFIFFSTAAVYPNRSGALHENILPAPIEIYGLSKYFGEQLVARFSQDTNRPCLIFRLFNVYGDYESKPHVVARIIKQAASGDILELGDLNPVRDYIFVDDVVSALIHSAFMPARGVQTFNLGTGKGTSVKQLVELVENILQRRFTIRQKEELLRQTDRMEMASDVSKLRELTGWQARFDLRQGLTCLLEREGLMAPQTIEHSRA